MRNVTRSIVVLALLLCASRVGADPLEATKWKIKVSPQDDARAVGEKEHDDVISFKGGMFASEYGAKQGFKPVKYDDDTRRFGPATFTAEMESDSAGKAKWSGTITAVTIKGQVVCTRKDGTVVTLDYQGERSDQ